MPILLKDLRYAIRQLRKSPGFALTAILTLALGVGANVVVFSVLNALIMKPLNVPNPRNLYNMTRKSEGSDTAVVPRLSGLPQTQYHLQGIAAYNMTQAGIQQGNSSRQEPWL